MNAKNIIPLRLMQERKGVSLSNGSRVMTILHVVRTLLLLQLPTPNSLLPISGF